MEEAREYSAVSNAAGERLDIEFLRQHLLLIDTHLRIIHQATIDFDDAYSGLTQTEYDIEDANHRKKIWDDIMKLSHSCWQISHVLSPHKEGPRRETSTQEKRAFKSFVQKRSAQIRALMNIRLSDKTILADIRNHAVHVDHRLDEWYFFQWSAGQRSLSVSFRTLANDTKPPIEPSKAALFWFDYHWGKVYHLGAEKPHSLRSLKGGIELVADGLRDADKRLGEYFAEAGRNSIFNGPLGWRKKA